MNKVRELIVLTEAIESEVALKSTHHEEVFVY